MSKGRELEEQRLDGICDGMIKEPIIGVEQDEDTKGGAFWSKELVIVELVVKVEIWEIMVEIELKVNVGEE